MLNEMVSFFILFKYILPFKKGFFSNGNFKFSYITETVLMVIIVLFFIGILFLDACEVLWNYIVSIIISIIIFVGLVWLNVFLSNTLCSCISNYFIIISLILNIVIYFIIGYLLSFLITWLDVAYRIPHPKPETKRTHNINEYDKREIDSMLLTHSIMKEKQENFLSEKK